MEIYTKAIEKAVIKNNCVQYSQNGPYVIVLSTGAELMMSIADLLSDRFSVYCLDLTGSIKKRSELIWSFSQFQTPLICALWLSLRPASEYLANLYLLDTKAVNSFLYLKGIVDTQPIDWEILGYSFFDDLEDLPILALDQHE